MTKYLITFLSTISLVLSDIPMIDQNLFDPAPSGGAKVDYNKINEIVESNLRSAFDTPSTGEIYNALTNDLVYIIVTNSLMNQASANARYNELLSNYIEVTNELSRYQSQNSCPVFLFNLNYSLPGLYYSTNSIGASRITSNDTISFDIFDYNSFEFIAQRYNNELYRASISNRVNNSFIIEYNSDNSNNYIRYNSLNDFDWSSLPLNLRLTIDISKLSDSNWVKDSRTEYYINRIPRPVGTTNNWIRIYPIYYSNVE